MTITDGAWLPQEDVLAYLGMDDSDSEASSVSRARLAAAAYVERNRPDLLTLVELTPTYLPTPEVFEGALLLTARLHARKASPTGLASYGEFGPAAVLRFDPDVERLLGVGRYAPPAVG